MDTTFKVQVCKGLVTNKRKGTTRVGYWVPIVNIPADVAEVLGCAKHGARWGLAWDTVKRQWRDMSGAIAVTTIEANAVLVTLEEGTKGIALLDF